jgi:hypothetical protein
MSPLLKEVYAILDRYSGSNEGPDAIIRDYIADCLASLEKAQEARDKWHGFSEG